MLNRQNNFHRGRFHWMMRSGSSRLFIVLLHLVGVRTNLPLNKGIFFNVGIVGVHPVAIILEKLQLDPIDGLDGLLRKMPMARSEGILSDPYWLQDDLDGRCLGPSSFAECGDSTLWVLHRRKPLQGKKKKRGFLGLFHGEEGSESNNVDSGYALQLIDTEVIPSTSRPGEAAGIREFVKRQIFDKKNGSDLECLMIDRKAKTDEGYHLLRLGSCSSPRAWGWRIDGEGALNHANWVKSKKDTVLCVWRRDLRDVIVAPCDSKLHVQAQEDDERDTRIVDFSLLRYKTNPSVPLSNSADVIPMSNIGPKNSSTLVGAPPAENTNLMKTSSTVPHTLSSSSDSLPKPKHVGMHPELKPMSALLFTPLSQESHAVSVIKDSNPVMMGSRASLGKDEREWLPLQPLKLGSAPQLNSGRPQLARKNVGSKDINKHNLIHLPPSSTSTSLPVTKISVAAPRKIPVHRYFAAAKNNMWKDPETGLDYYTDLREYLGFTRKSYGRHTLTGVGQYTRTVFKVKVYGVAFYVSKRDVLSDSGFQRFATLSVEELQQSSDFYSYLLKGNFDKTLLLKLNMQLSVEVMMETLNADWSMLSQDLKDIIIASNKRSREAEKKMLNKIKSTENSSNCSCSQSAPPEYNADPRCCARGTELAFTWMKNGDFVIRLDGRIMDTFAGRKEIGYGIFHEYLNPLDPMSFDALYHFSDGFPFLLAPLAQVKGVSVGQMSDHSSDSFQSSNKFGIQGAIEFIDDKAVMAATWIQANIDGAASHFSDAAKAVGDTSRNTSKFFNRKGAEAAYHIDSISSHTLNFAILRIPFIPEAMKENARNAQFSKVSTSSELTDEQTNGTPSIISSEQWCHKNLLEGHYSCGNVPRRNDYFFGVGELSDEIGAIIHPTSNFSRKLFTYTVHLYLMLLFFVSLPESSSTRKVKCKIKKLTGCSSSDDEEPDAISESDEESEDDTSNNCDGPEKLKRSVMPKSLSYYL